MLASMVRSADRLAHKLYVLGWDVLPESHLPDAPAPRCRPLQEGGDSIPRDTCPVPASVGERAVWRGSQKSCSLDFAVQSIRRMRRC